MPSVAASAFASLTASPPSDDAFGLSAAQSDTFGTMLGAAQSAASGADAAGSTLAQDATLSSNTFTKPVGGANMATALGANTFDVLLNISEMDAAAGTPVLQTPTNGQPPIDAPVVAQDAQVVIAQAPPPPTDEAPAAPVPVAAQPDPKAPAPTPATPQADPKAQQTAPATPEAGPKAKAPATPTTNAPALTLPPASLAAPETAPIEEAATVDAKPDTQEPDQPVEPKADVPDIAVADAPPPPEAPIAMPLAALLLAAPPAATPAVSAETPAPASTGAKAVAGTRAASAISVDASTIAAPRDRLDASSPINVPIGNGKGNTGSGGGGDASSRTHHANAHGDAATTATPRDAAATFTLPMSAAPAATADARAPQTHSGVITAEPGRIGQELGVAIAHHVANGAATGAGEAITLRLNPVDMGRIEVRLSFDDGGTLRAIVSADNPAALDMLRRDSADLTRALSNAGVRADTQTLNFDTRSGSGGNGNANGQSWQRQNFTNDPTRTGTDTAAATPDDIVAAYRPMRTRGRVDMVA